MTGPEVGDGDAATFHGDILVGSKIIDYLSSGLYESPASCLKELVNNSYDADATEVHVLVKPDADMIAIEDDGVGMTRDIFVRHFSRISESHKRDDDATTLSGRPKIGKIGIGFIAANELCNEMEIYSTQAGSVDLLHVTIDFAVMREPEVDRRVEGTENLKKGDFEGSVSPVADETEHYTKIYLKQVRGSAREALVGAHPPRPEMRPQSLYGLRAESIRNRLAHLDTWSALDAYSQTRLGVALNVPVRYPTDWLPGKPTKSVAEIVSAVSDLEFNVIYDGTALEKPIVLTEGDSEGHLLHHIALDGEHVGGEGYLFARHGIMRPNELNGILIRIRNAGVGEYSSDFLGFPSSTGQLFQRWISGEFYADDRLEDALNIDRRTLRETHPAYIELRTWLHNTVASFISDTRSTLYTAKSNLRKRAKSAASVRAIQAIATAASEKLSPDTGRAIAETWATADFTDTRSNRPLNRTYSVAEVYEIVIDIAGEILPTELQKEFIAELNRRLRG